LTNRSFTPKGKRHIYWGRRLADDQALLGVDDLAVPIGYSRHEYVVFDATGMHWAALGIPPSNQGAVILRDGETLGPFTDAGVPSWSPTGVLAYLRAGGEPGPGRQIELVVGDTITHGPVVAGPTCLPMFGEELKGPEMALHTNVRHLSDGRVLAVVPHEGRWAVIRGDDVLATFDASTPTSPGSVGPYALGGAAPCQAGSVIVATSLTTAAQAPVAAWWERAAASDGTWRVVVDGTPVANARCLRPWPHQPPQLSDDGRVVAFPCVTRFDEHGEAIVVVHGDRQYGPYPEVWALALTNDGRRLAYGASDGSLDLGWAIYADGVQASERYYSVWRPRFDPTMRHLGWEATRTNTGPNIFVLDGRPLATFDDLVDGPIFDRSGEVGWIVRRKHRIARVNFPLGP
jgi:hypothetical protein